MEPLPSAETPSLQHPRLWRRPEVRRLLLIALLAEIGYAVLNISAMPVYLRRDLGLDTSAVGFVLVAFLLSESIFKSPMGSLADRMGRKRLIVIGPALTVLTALATLAIPRDFTPMQQTVTLMILRVFDGIGASMIWPALFALVGDIVPPKERQEGMSFLNMCYLIGLALALPVGGLVNDLSGSRASSFFLAAALFAGVAVFSYRALPSERERRATRAETNVEEPGFFDIVHAFKRIPKHLAFAMLIFAAIGFPSAIVKLFAQDQFKLSESQFGFLVLPAALFMTVLSAPMSRRAERMGRVKALQLGLALCVFGLGLIALGGIIPFLRAAWAFGLGGLPLGLGFLLAVPAWYAIVSDLDPDRRAANLGATMTAQGIGAIVTLPIGGMMYSKLQLFGPSFARYSPFIACTLCLILGWLLSLRFSDQIEDHEGTIEGG